MGSVGTASPQSSGRAPRSEHLRPPSRGLKWGRSGGGAQAAPGPLGRDDNPLGACQRRRWGRETLRAPSDAVPAVPDPGEWG